MTVGVLLYCFDTPDTAYHKLATKCVELVKKNLRVPITVVTDNTTHKKLNTLDVSFKIVEQSKNNFRFTEEKMCLGITWNEPKHLIIVIMTQLC